MSARVPALVLGLNVTGYGVVRALYDAGVEVHAVHEGPNQFATASRLCRTMHHVARDGYEVERLVALLHAFREPPVVFPTSDRYAALLAEHRARFEPLARFHWVSTAQLWEIADKARVAALCDAADVLAPRTIVPEPDADVAALAASLPYPAIVKPIDSIGTGLPGGVKNLLLRSPDEARSLFGEYPELLGRVVVQEVIEGEDDDVVQCIAFVARDGHHAGIATMRKLRQYPPGYGMTCFGRTEPLPEIERMTQRFVEHIDWRGIAALEFKRSRTDGRYYFIEMNPRLPWYNAMFTDSGINFPELVYRDLTSGLRTSDTVRPDRSVHWLCFEHDVATLSRNRAAGRTSLGAWLRTLPVARSFAWFNANDPGPFLRATWHLISLTARRAAGRAGLRPRHDLRSPVE